MAWAVSVFAFWTIGYHVALFTPLSASLLWWSSVIFALVSGTVTLALVRREWNPVAGDATPMQHAAAITLGLAAAVLSSCLVRPDLDDASYMVRSTWIAEHGVLHVGDVIFSNGAWPGLPEQTPYLPSFEGLAGIAARITGEPAAGLLYTAYVPLGAFLAVWAQWSLLRTWRIRRPALALAVAAVFLCWGGPLNASWGNLSIGRIWQGKVTLLAIAVPLAYSWVVRAAGADRGRRQVSSVLRVATLGVASTGLSPAAVFVIPGVVAVVALAAALAGRRRAALWVALAGGAYPLAGGLLTVFLGHTAEAIPGSTTINPWERTVGSGLPAVVVGCAAVAALIGLLSPRFSAIGDPIARLTAGGAVVAGAAVGVPALYGLLVAVMRTDAIAWRAVWVVPLPALVGLLAVSVRGRARWSACLAVGLSVVLIGSGTPLWSARNGAHLASAGSWKVAPDDLETARWIVGYRPNGRYVAREQVVAAVGTLTAQLFPVGSRPGYVLAYAGLPEAQSAARLELQNWADDVDTADPARIAAELDALDVVVVCGSPRLGDVLRAGWSVGYRSAETCWTRR